MPEVFEKFFPGFRIADSELLTGASTKVHTLRLSIREDDSQVIEILFKNVLAYKFQYGSAPNRRNDETYIVQNSNWLTEQIKLFKQNYPSDDTMSLVHYKFCFNSDNEELDVICDKDLTITGS